MMALRSARSGIRLLSTAASKGSGGEQQQPSWLRQHLINLGLGVIAASSTAYVYHKTKAEEVMHTEAQKWLYECGSWRKKVERCKLEWMAQAQELGVLKQRFGALQQKVGFTVEQYEVDELQQRMDQIEHSVDRTKHLVDQMEQSADQMEHWVGELLQNK